jgi:hypothetical protein
MVAIAHPTPHEPSLEAHVPAFVGGRTAARSRPSAVYRRRRAVAAVLAAALAIAFAAIGGPLVTTAFDGGADSSVADSSVAEPTAALHVDVSASGHHVIVVQPGDTLWSIARRLDPEADPRPLVDRLVALNGVVAVAPGQRLVLPGP